MNAERIVDALLGDTDPQEFMNGLPKDFWARFHIIKSGDDSVYADDPWRHTAHIVYVDRLGELNSRGDQIRDFVGYIQPHGGGGGPAGVKWKVVRVKHPGKSGALRKPVQAVGQYPDKHTAAEHLYREYLSYLPESDMSPEEFLNSLNQEKPHVLNRFMFTDKGVQGVQVWMTNGTGGPNFIGYIMRMGSRWYAHRALGHLISTTKEEIPYRDTPEEAAEDVWNTVIKWHGM